MPITYEGRQLTVDYYQGDNTLEVSTAFCKRVGMTPIACLQVLENLEERVEFALKVAQQIAAPELMVLPLPTQASLESVMTTSINNQAEAQ